MKVALLSTLLSLVIGSSAFAGGVWFESGNGGFVVTCPQKSPVVLDLHEGEDRYGMIQDKDVDSLQNLDTRMAYLLRRLYHLDPSRVVLYIGWYKSFKKDAVFVEGTFKEVSDVGLGVAPVGCKFELAAFQRTPNRIVHHRYVINKTLWTKMDVLNQAALLMHEFIYRESLSFQIITPITSETSRYLNSFINSVAVDMHSPTDYYLMLRDLGLNGRNDDKAL